MTDTVENLINEMTTAQTTGKRVEIHFDGENLLLRDCFLLVSAEIDGDEIELKSENRIINLCFTDVTYDAMEEYYILNCGSVNVYLFFHRV